MKEITDALYAELKHLGVINDDEKENIRDYNIGGSDYASRVIQPWSIWLEYDLNPFDADIIKRVLRNKLGESRKSDYEKIIHICKERIRQIDTQIATMNNDIEFEEVD